MRKEKSRSARDNRIVFQTGSQQRSEFGLRFRKAVELIRAGGTGDLKSIRIGVGVSPKPCDLPDQETPDNVDWDLWLGPAPQRGYHEEPCPKGIHNHYPAFRKYEEYSGGMLADIGYKLRRKLTWDPAKEEFPGDAEANALTTRKPREGWEYA